MPYAVPEDFTPADLACRMESYFDVLSSYLQRLFDQMEDLDRNIDR
jgi:hypothetical protein